MFEFKLLTKRNWAAMATFFAGLIAGGVVALLVGNHQLRLPLLVYLAQLLFKFGDLFLRGHSELFVLDKQKEVPILHDLHFEAYTFVIVSHGSFSIVLFYIRTMERLFLFNGNLSWRFESGRREWERAATLHDTTSAYEVPQLI
jgi:hypothetical protein